MLQPFIIYYSLPGSSLHDDWQEFETMADDVESAKAKLLERQPAAIIEMAISNHPK